MYNSTFLRFLFFATVFLFIGKTDAQEGSSTRLSFNKGWKFSLVNDSLAVQNNYNDSGWRILNLPHDWSIEGVFSEKNPAKPEGGGLPTGIAWYRKSFEMPASKRNQKVYIDFDGVYQHSEVWINGTSLGKRPNGYISFRYDLTPYLKYGNERNIITVKVDNSAQPNSRWYSGSGIYRNVWLDITEKVHVAHWGTFITTPKVTQESATVLIQTELSNTSGLSKQVAVKTTLYSADGKQQNITETKGVHLPDSSTSISQQFEVKKPALWSVDQPNLYKAVVQVFEDKKLVDTYSTTFGIRYFDFDRHKGFSLNGKPLKILGVCNHHDLGALGAAVNIRAMERQLEILKAMGCNGIRMAHNPTAPELLDLCDKMGFIVMDETFDMWNKKKNKNDYHFDFKEWHERDLTDHIKRDRNHASVFMWSVGNEIREQFDSTGIAITKELVAIIKRLDATRPVTSALTEMVPSKNFIYQSGALDLLGFNYNHAKYDSLPLKFINQKFIASETTSGLMTRGHYDMPSDSIRRWPINAKTKLTDGNADWTVSAYDNVSAYWGSTHEETWKTVKKLDFISGLYVWTGFDYLGEPTPYPWPARSSYFGIVDLAGFPKDIYYMYQSEWTNKPVLHIFPHWNWEAGKTVDVWAYYNQADEVELYLNENSLGIRKKTGDDVHVMWRVPFQAGTLKAVSRKNGKEVLVKEIKTAGRPFKIEMTADRNEIKANGTDLSFITVKVLDKEGNLIPDADDLIQFTLDGNATIAGVDNGYQASMEPFKANSRKAFNGLCLAIIQSTEKAGTIKLVARAAGLQAATLLIKSK
ncbi:beta-galactosidase GalB [Arcticibacter eurypsychrophilus]|uniref:beta-galactosidase GalB n=1 Tax=Arcticibacter eurypsychrophilus TaxID=1434752 RepID=UPI00084D3284|nr:beta-galactosidase GalB [Arcticibacter eurypsychrophilus]